MSFTQPPASNGVQANGDGARPLLERLSTPPHEYPSVRNREDVPMQSLQEPAFPYGSLNPSYNERRSDWFHSLGLLFSHSRRFLAPPLAAGEFHATVTPCTSDELRFRNRAHRMEQSGEDQRRNRFDLDIVNRVEYFGLKPTYTETIYLGCGQLVHRVVHRNHPAGRRIEVDLNGPYIIIDRCHTHYLLMTSRGDLFPNLVPAPCLYPCLSTWHVVEIPLALLSHPEVE
jgi:hypothetical protein